MVRMDARQPVVTTLPQRRRGQRSVDPSLEIPRNHIRANNSLGPRSAACSLV